MQRLILLSCFIFIPIVLGELPDPARPKFHFLPEANWLNDPNGMFYFNGYYHVFYQYATTVQSTNLKYWGHAISKDLVTWQRLPIGLYPDQPGADIYGVWSGSAIVVNNSMIMAIYTGINEPTVTDAGAQTVCLAYPNSTDGTLINWYKDIANPVISGPPDYMKNLLVAYRDPCIWNQNGTYYFILGSGVRDLHGVALLYKSTDLHSWTYEGLFAEGDDDDGYEWECPDYFSLPTPDGKTLDCLFLSIPGTGIGWKVGHTDLSKMKFKPKSGTFRYDVGWNYAPRSFYDPVKKRQIQFGWLNEGRSGSLNEKEGWAGVMTLGREIFVREDYTLGLRPLEEQQQLRTGVLFSMSNYTFPTNYINWHNVFREFKSNQYEFIAKFKITKAPQASDRFGIIVLADPGFTEYTRLFIDLDANTVGYDLTHGSTDQDTDHSINQLDYQVSDTITLHGFVDHSVIEVFVNEQIVLTPRVYPAYTDSLHMGLYYEQATDDAQPSKIMLSEFTVYGVDSIW